MSRLLPVRIFLGAVFFAAFCLLFLESIDSAFLAAWQLGPALLAGNIAALIVIAIITLLFGRVYCAVFCPLGVGQDLLARLNIWRKYRNLPAWPIPRYLILAVFLAGIVLGLPILFVFLDPYSAFGRVMTDFFSPLWDAAHNALAWSSRQLESYAVVSTASRPQGWIAIGTAIFTLLALILLSWKAGRVWCNLCPIGALLGLLARFSLWRIRINGDSCVACGKCERVCKTGCIDAKAAKVDNSRCVACFNCLGACPQAGLTYSLSARLTPAEKQGTAPGRRALLFSALPALLALPVQAAMLPPGRDDKPPTRKNRPARPIPITPPGSDSQRHFNSHCSGCQLCVSACPTDILASFRDGPGLLQPTLSFEYGFCIPGCTRCGNVCPTSAIRKFTAQEKSQTQIGMAEVDFNRCIVHTEDIPCKACYHICPPQIIELEPVPGMPDNFKRPRVPVDKCIGCGACEFVCPARPIAAIKVNGSLQHRLIAQ